ncbi:uncharacterized protein A1O9_05283 [Exophiala aquamarina CBS 119918]|uniref:Smr domain-containing protein n=1 Tax=Exophiala aquamarina CBS 119918 TaxID=1182545 RepID=A0A072PBZ4_9EURO|nr:uncharacterized protein A1O9_05283 [Exophiala aquamarina CBS 119918]KEF57366.1 hypothetical protein A1O9_05283 [Exophiala aquamarina CBS 119918]
MSYEMSAKGPTRVGGRPFNHDQSQAAEQEYDRLRDLARQEAGKRSSALSKSQQAYQKGDGAAAKALSEEGKAHGLKMEQFNRQASEFIFRENNAEGRAPADTIDLHGQFVEEAEDILEERIRYAQSHGQTHLHVIVGKGNHSTGHVQKIKPRVEQVCRELNLQYHTEENEGRIYVNLSGGNVNMQDVNSWGGYQQGYGQQQQHHHHQQQQQQQQQYQQQGGQQHHQQNQGGQNDEVEKMVKRFLPRILKKLLGMFCGR